MPDIVTTRRYDRPTEGLHTARLSAHPGRPVRLFLPSDYQPKYAYPLVVVFHPEGGDEGTAARLAPALSRRNYITACLRGSVAFGPGDSGRPAFGWGDGADGDGYLRAVLAHARSEYHIHAERIYLAGFGEGATAAYRLGLAMSGVVAGVVALNGRLPVSVGRSLSRRKSVGGVRVFVGHGVNNPVVPVSTARRDARLLASTGLDVRFTAYPATHQIHADMLRDVNRWIMDAVSPAPDTVQTSH